MAQTQTIMIVGAGQMGRGIARIAAQAGFKVLLHDMKDELLQESYATIKLELDAHADTDSDGRKRILANISLTTKLQDSVRSDFVIEAAPENISIKQQIFSNLSHYITQDTILASNTSSLSISDIASATDCPERIIGMHFIYPVTTMTLVEIVKGMKTSEQTLTITRELAHYLGKEAIEVNDFPGFVSNRLLMLMINEAVICVFDGVADIESVDRISRLGMSYPMGPLQLADMIGIDTCLSIMENLHRSLDEPKYRPCPLLRTMVKAGKLGRKTGEGFYLYDN